MRRLGFALVFALLLAATGSLAAKDDKPFEQKLSKDKQAVHALNRLTFGARPGDVDRVRRLGVERWIRQQLEPERLPASAMLEARLQPLDTLQLTTSQILEKYPARPNAIRIALPQISQFVSADQVRTLNSGTPEQRLAIVASISAEHLRAMLAAMSPKMLEGLPALQKQAASLRQAELMVRLAEAKQLSAAPVTVNQQLIDAKLYRALYSDRQLEEVLVDFWLNHFNVFNGKGSIRQLLTSYERDAIRPYVLGRFRDLLLVTARHPAMLFYLDNWQSQVPPDLEATPIPGTRRRPGLNENYGRELMELHTLGVDGGYSQEDVIAVARAFTGWTIRDLNRVAEFQFNPAMHDDREKRVLGHTIAAGGGEQDGIRVIDILTRHPSTARFISRKLAQRFVADDPPQTLVDRMTATFARTDGDIRAVLETLFTSREFLSEGAWQAKLKSPLELVLSAARSLGADVTKAAALSQRIAELGQPLYGKQEPTGYPDRSEAWANSAGFLGRINFANALANGQIEGLSVDLTRLPGKTSEAAEQLLGVPPSRATLAILEKGLSGKDASAPGLVAVVIASPDFQRR